MAVFALIHGSWHDGTCWQPLVDELTARGHEVVAPSLPCDDLTATWQTYADVVAESLAGHPDPPVVVGHSLGAITAALFATQHPARLVIYLNPSTPASNIPDGMPPGFRDGADEGIVTTKDGVEHWESADAAIRVMYRNLDPADGRRLAQRLRHQADPGPIPVERPPRVPSAYIYASDDEVFTPESRQWCAEHIFGVEPIVLTGGHFPMVEQPAHLADVLCGVLDAS